MAEHKASKAHLEKTGRRGGRGRGRGPGRGRGRGRALREESDHEPASLRGRGK